MSLTAALKWCRNWGCCGDKLVDTWCCTPPELTAAAVVTTSVECSSPAGTDQAIARGRKG